MVRVGLPYHLRTLAQVGDEVTIDVSGPITPNAIIDALETCYPPLRGTIRDYTTNARRPYLRFFACEQDLSLDPLDRPLPAAVASGAEPFLIIGAMSGG